MVQQDTWEEESLRLVADTVVADLESGEVLDRLMGRMCWLMDVETVLFLVNDRGHGDVVIKNVSDERLTRIYHVALNWEEGIIERCIQTNATLLLDEPNQLPIQNLYDSVTDIRVRSLLCVPLTVAGNVLGAVVALNKSTGVFDNRDQELIAALANAYAHSLHSKNQIRQLKLANSDLETVQGQLTRSRNTLRTLFDSIPISIYIVDRKYTLMAVNMQRANRTNHLPNLLVGRRCYEALYGRSNVCAGCRVAETFANQQSTLRTWREVLNEEGDALDWEITAYPVHDDRQQVMQVILVEQDMTDQLSMEAVLAQSEKLAAVGQMAAVIAHEINNPLTAILANAQLLQREIPSGDDKLEMVDLIARAGGRALQVVRDLLNLARMEQYEFTLTDVNDTILEAVAIVQHELDAHSIPFKMDVADNLPLIQASADHLQGVWINLLTNAMDAVRDQQGEICLIACHNEDGIHVRVTDTGVGIPVERLERIFEPFYTTKAPGRGTGLGLTVCQRVIRQHGGRITVNSKVGVGTEFEVVLPVTC